VGGCPGIRQFVASDRAAPDAIYFSSTTGAATRLIVGDFSNYLIARRQGMTVELVPHLTSTGSNLPQGRRGWFAWARIGGGVVNSAAFKIQLNT